MLDKGFSQKTSNGVWWIGIMLRDGVDAEAIKTGSWAPPPEDAVAAQVPGRSSAGLGDVEGERVGGDDWISGGDWTPGD